MNLLHSTFSWFKKNSHVTNHTREIVYHLFEGAKDISLKNPKQTETWSSQDLMLYITGIERKKILLF